jgi:ribose transport system ATP-binding protein
MHAIFGNLPYDSGRVLINGEAMEIRCARDAINAGIGFITEDRKTEGLLLEKSIAENIELANLGKVSSRSVLSKAKGKELVKKGIDEFHIKCFGPEHECSNLSGGNQQKVVIAKWVYTDPKVLILDEPTRGVDIGAKKEIYNVINDLAAKGVAIIMVSSELPEVLGMSDRIMVVHEGKVTGIIDAAQADQEKVMTLATGGTL